MCVIAYKPADRNMSREVMERCFVSNPNGAGYMFPHNGTLIIRKPFFSFEELYSSAIADGVVSSGVPCVFHYRITTHGENDKINTHPHRIDIKTGMVHNGILSQHAQKDSKLSDTVMFNNNVLRKLPRNWIFNQGVVSLLNNYICEEFSKLIIMTGKGDVLIFNEGGGVWDEADKCWYSNLTYKYRYASYTPPPTTFPAPKTEVGPEWVWDEDAGEYIQSEDAAEQEELEAQAEAILTARDGDDEEEGVVYDDTPIEVEFTDERGRMFDENGNEIVRCRGCNALSLKCDIEGLDGFCFDCKDSLIEMASLPIGDRN